MRNYTPKHFTSNCRFIASCYKILTLVIFALLFFDQAHAQLQIPVPGRPDNLTQKEVDMLLGGGSMNFDGMRFDNKRMDYINFGIGSFRGTTFFKSILNFGIARRQSMPAGKLDFESANIYVCEMQDVYFSFWNCTKATFMIDTLTNATFSNCLLDEVSFNGSGFFKPVFTNDLNLVTQNANFFFCTFNGGTFNKMKFLEGNFSIKLAKGVNFNDVEFTNMLFDASGLNHSVFEACSFQRVKFNGVAIKNVTFNFPQLKTKFDDVIFNNVSWSGGTVNAAFFNPCSFIGSLTQLNGIDFGSSVFNNTVFGVQNAGYKINIRKCKFSACSFDAATFYNCNLENCTFPPISDLQAAGVRFVNCIGAPYNSN